MKSKTFDFDFMDVIDGLENSYSTKIYFTFTEKDIDEVLNKITIYKQEELKRVKQVLYQRNKYHYFFE